MPLILKVLSYKGQPLPSELSARFDNCGGNIGRKAGNAMVLSDPENFISGHHAEIIYLNGQYHIKDTSKNGTYLTNASSTLNNTQALLLNNEVLRIGEYEILVEIVSDSPIIEEKNIGGMFDAPFAGSFAGEANSPMGGALNAPGPAPDRFSFIDTPAATPFQDSFKPSEIIPPLGSPGPAPDRFPFSNNSPFQDSFNPSEADNPLGGPLNAPKPPVDAFSFVDRPPSSPFQDSFRPPDVVTPQNEPQDIAGFLKGLDSLSSIGGVAAPVVPEPIIPIETPSTPAPFGASSGVDGFLQNSPEIPPIPFGTEASFVSPVTPVVAPNPVSTPVIPEQIVPVEMPSTPSPFAESPGVDNLVQNIAAIPTPPVIAKADVVAPVSPVVKPTPVSSPASPPAASPTPPQRPDIPVATSSQPGMASTQADADLMQYFLEGAGIKDRAFLTPEQWAEAMKSTGALFRTLIEGLMDVLRARAEMKSEFRVSVTTIRSFDNNPLKFNPDVESVLKLMMSPNNPAFIHPNDAAIEAFKDIKYHQIAMTAGIQASLGEIMKRFNPEVFEQILGEGIFLQKKARCWELYCEKYPELKTMALEDFFGEEFADAYEKQMRMLSRK